MYRRVELFVLDIFISIQKIKHTVKKFKTQKELFYSYESWNSVIRELEVIGEATKYLIKEGALPEDYRVIVNFRNVIIHNYFGIDAEEIWDVVKNDLLEFEKIIRNLIYKMVTEDAINDFIEDNKYLDFIVEELEKLK